jgi:hypothetical protein
VTDLGSNRYRSYVNKLAAAGLLDVPSGGKFRADEAVTPEDAVAILFKAFGYKYSGNYMDSAYKAGFVTGVDFSDMLMEEAVAMVVRAYEVKSGNKADPNPPAASLSPGVEEVDESLRGRVQFAIDNGLLLPLMPTGKFPTGKIVTRGELAAIIAVTLEFLGVL